jgi:hypothetical protein
MSLYNMVCGVDELTPFLAKVLDLDIGLKEQTGKYKVPRFRDIHLSKDGNILLLTRMGGNNRKDMTPPEWIGWASKLKKHPCYIKDYDDEYDSTFAWYVFKVPAKYKKECSKLKNHAYNLKKQIEDVCKAL